MNYAILPYFLVDLINNARDARDASIHVINNSIYK